jgi:hypothetical protein
MPVEATLHRCLIFEFLFYSIKVIVMDLDIWYLNFYFIHSFLL